MYLTYNLFMNTKIVSFIFALLLFLLNFGVIKASGFNLQSIGGLDTSGKQISHWWYTGLQPTFKGEAPPDSTITIVIDEVSETVNSDSTGSWIYTPTTLSSGDHNIRIENNENKITFTLTLGSENINWDTINQEGSSSALPAAGVAFPTIALIGSGGLIFGFGSKFLKHN